MRKLTKSDDYEEGYKKGRTDEAYLRGLSAEITALKAERDKLQSEVRLRQEDIHGLANKIVKLRAALEGVLADIADYERINNLAPNPGREYCWDSVAAAHRALKETK